MIRKFCDLCDEQIQDDEREFSINVQETSQDGYLNSKDFRMDDGQFETAKGQIYSMVCVHCVLDVVGMIHVKKKR